MNSFTKPLIVQLKKDGTHWILKEAFSYYTYINDIKQIINIPKDFGTDFASIPKIFCFLISKRDIYNRAPVVHDFLYSTINHNFTRRQSDKIFLEAMKVLKINWFKRTTFYISVRLFGWLFWKKNKKK